MVFFLWFPFKTTCTSRKATSETKRGKLCEGLAKDTTPVLEENTPAEGHPKIESPCCSHPFVEMPLQEDGLPRHSPDWTEDGASPLPPSLCLTRRSCSCPWPCEGAHSVSGSCGSRQAIRVGGGGGGGGRTTCLPREGGLKVDRCCQGI